MADENKQKVIPAYLPLETRVLEASDILYCGVCSLPPEFCSFGSTAETCLTWLKQNNAQLLTKIYPNETNEFLSEVNEKVSELSLEDEKKSASKSTETKAEKDKKKKPANSINHKVLVKRVDRNKRKFVTVVSGLENFDVDLKKAAKQFANKFACGSSVTKNAAGTSDEIVVQGDFLDDIVVLISSTYKH
ncbi:Translation machinery-associated protein 22, partial [Nowakowskiella sp. JEL0078]